MLTVAIFHLMRKITSEGRKPAMEKSIFAFPPLPFLPSLCLRRFILTSFGKSQNSFASGKVGSTDLYYFFIKAPFRRIWKQLRQWKGGTHMSIYLSNNVLRKTDFGLRNPPRRSSFFIFRHSIFWSFHWVLMDSGDEIMTLYERYSGNMNNFPMIKILYCIYKLLRKKAFGVRNPPRRSRILIFRHLISLFKIKCKQSSGAT